MIRLATLSDMLRILQIKDLAISHMYHNQIFQWNESYPSEEILKQDIGSNELYVIEDQRLVVGFACINTNQSPEYQSLIWTTAPKAYVVHRLAIDPTRTGKGYATQLMNFAETHAKSQNTLAMRIDTFSQNTFAQQLFQKLGYTYIGEVFFDRKEEPFYCYEKHLGSF
ncbi:MAG: GNAT family N-acetyltransferase [Cellulosilyticaceae bacterium]